ncbi:AAA family ATPase [Olivibacter sp. LS-1]|uniref:DEAD/DEAH box helicase n=1 Tax=Olivibacter sp. LS-1 TaxID=2592345 RepID=UPI0011EB3D16|nr:ATP-binding domain-containing protein [Olivibacter sp. LS-1]QEL03446.1 AAA family ATPase [Olivibacter sp. LS-1]
MLNIIRGDLKSKPAATSLLIDAFEQIKENFDGSLYIGYPIIGTSEGGFQIDALLVSPTKGVILFNLIEDPKKGIDYEEIQDENYQKFSSKMLQHKEVVNRRKIAFDIVTASFAPTYAAGKTNGDYLLFTSKSELISFIENYEYDLESYYKPILSIIQSITSISKTKNRNYVKSVDSRGGILSRLEASIANLDSAQSEAVIETVDGVQRIRGLAGSGKSIVLALKVAYLHAKNPEWNIAVTFNTRSLKGQFEKFITNFSYSHQNHEPDWNKIHIIHAWGSSPKNPGIYYNFCMENKVVYRDYEDARGIAPRYGEEFDIVCKEALETVKSVKEKYDLIVVDEAQDFSPDFLRICYKLLTKNKRLVYAYDELQNLNDKQMLSPESLFGLDDETGRPLVDLKNEEGKPKKDIILYKCYRNPKEILTTAHALGFGIYRDPELVQMFDQAYLWRDIGYDIKDGELADDKRVVLERTNRTSPEFLSEHSPIDDILRFEVFENNETQVKYIVEEIWKNITQDELKLDDIIVINPNPLTTKSVVGVFRQALFDKGINSELAGVTSSPDIFYSDKYITFTGINRAKGNEAAMVYIINAQFCYAGMELSRKRNILFTAMTRSKAWVRVCGYGINMVELKNEYEKVKRNNFRLDFVYPNEEKRKILKIVNRDMSDDERRSVERNNNNLKDIVNDLQNGLIKREDLPRDLLEQLRSLL